MLATGGFVAGSSGLHAGGQTPAVSPATAGRSREGDLRSRLFLVCRSGLRQAARRDLHDIRVHRRPDRNPTYEQVSRGGTGHVEAVEIVFNPSVVTYDQLLEHFWHNVDPFVAQRQFCDVGDQYRPEIFVHSAAQRAAAEASRQRVQKRFKQPIVVKVDRRAPFYVAEAYHQDYHNTHAVQYRFYRWTCGRDARLRQIWRDS